LNYDATESDYKKFGKCRCGGHMEWKYNYIWQKVILEKYEDYI
jgi:hypothetical protein